MSTGDPKPSTHDFSDAYHLLNKNTTVSGTAKISGGITFTPANPTDTWSREVLQAERELRARMLDSTTVAIGKPPGVEPPKRRPEWAAERRKAGFDVYYNNTCLLIHECLACHKVVKDGDYCCIGKYHEAIASENEYRRRTMAAMYSGLSAEETTQVFGLMEEHMKEGELLSVAIARILRELIWLRKEADVRYGPEELAPNPTAQPEKKKDFQGRYAHRTKSDEYNSDWDE